MTTADGEPVDNLSGATSAATVDKQLKAPVDSQEIIRAKYLVERAEIASHRPPDMEEYEGDRAENKAALEEIEASIPEIESLLDNPETFSYIFRAISSLAVSSNDYAKKLGYSILQRNIPLVCNRAVSDDSALSTVLSETIWWTRNGESSDLESLGYSITDSIINPLTLKIIEGNIETANLAAKALYDYVLEQQFKSEGHKLPSEGKAAMVAATLADNSLTVIDNILRIDGVDERIRYSNAVRIMLLSPDDQKVDIVVGQLITRIQQASEADIRRTSELVGNIGLMAGLIERILLDYKFPQKQIRHIISAWNDNSDNSEHQMKDIIAGNIATIHYLENQHNGSSQTLFHEFNIRNFCRWPKELLARQYERRNDTSHPYWVIFKPEGDEEGIFNRIESDTIFFDAVKEQIDVLAVEVGNYGWTFEEVHKKLNARYGTVRKIAGGTWGAHGKEDHMAFGTHGTDRLSLIPDIRDSNDWEFIRSCYMPHPTILLESCLVGVKNGTAQFLSGSERMNARIIASPISYHFLTFDGEITPHPDGSIDMRVLFDNDFRNVFDRGKMIHEDSLE